MWDSWYNQLSFGLTNENVYRVLIEGCGTAPRLLGHLTENGSRIIGCLVESPDARPATVDDLTVCGVVLQKLHDLGSAHGRIIRDNFHVLSNRIALLKDFFKPDETSDKAMLDKEMATVKKALVQPLWSAHEGGSISEDISRQL